MSNPEPLQYEHITVSLPSADQASITRFFRDKKTLGAPVFMLHSTLQDGTTFFSDDGNGLACYLARQGYDVFVADLRGKGRSWPLVGATSDYGYHHAITEDIPALIEKVVSKRGKTPQIWIGHGWGSVLMCSFYARYGDRHAPVARMAHFAARRQLTNSNSSKRLLMNFMWRKLGRLLLALNGYLPARFLRMGVTNESRANYQEYLQWSDSADWLDASDGFSYGEAIKQQQLPPSFYFAAKGDRAYGDPNDVRQFIQELGPHDGRFMVLSRAGGNLRDYNHLDMLRHKDCEQDHFPLLLDWLQQA
ncbi:alpha/beta fold hydrolase [Oceanicoccus sp. KOV_DT_Chl]|uniref:alpha/beta fold hydrolase n=1 Tax=Oceanicoccus sp. KOV_DT_Chl TaxID=1904639 RepID=UPI000C7A27F6|nr:alpha/beta fold hydrolase [Oceanicoccus sp. KOV_DT_Chl]